MRTAWSHAAGIRLPVALFAFRMIYVIDAVLRVGQTCLHHQQNAAALQIFSCAIADPAGTHYNPRSCFMICIFTMR